MTLLDWHLRALRNIAGAHAQNDAQRDVQRLLGQLLQNREAAVATKNESQIEEVDARLRDLCLRYTIPPNAQGDANTRTF